jgi:hypothetical protein
MRYYSAITLPTAFSAILCVISARGEEPTNSNSIAPCTTASIPVILGAREGGWRAQLSHSGRFVAFSTPGEVLVYETTTGKRVTSTPIGNQVAFSGDDETLAVREGASVRLWSYGSGTVSERSCTLPDDCKAMRLDFRGQRIFADCRSRVAIIGSGDTTVLGLHGGDLSRRTNWVSQQSVDAIVTLAEIGDEDSSIRVLSLDEPHAELVILGHTGSILHVSSDARFKRLISSSTDGTVRAWDLDRSAEIDRIDNPSNLAPAMSPDGHTVAFRSWESADIVLWRIGHSTTILSGHDHKVSEDPSITRALFSPASDILATGGVDGTVRLWRIRDSANILTLTNGTREVASPESFSDDGSRLATEAHGKAGSKIIVWDLRSRCPLLAVHEEVPPRNIHIVGQYLVWQRSLSAEVCRISLP